MTTVLPRLASLAILIGLCLAPALARAEGKCRVGGERGPKRLKLGQPQKSFKGLQLVSESGAFKTYTRKGDKLRFGGVPLKYLYYIFVNDALTYIQMRSKTYTYSGSPLRGYKVAEPHQKLMAFLDKTNGGCDATMTRETHRAIADSCEQRYGSKHCNAPRLWSERPVQLVSIFAVETPGESPEGPHKGYTVIEYTRALSE